MFRRDIFTAIPALIASLFLPKREVSADISKYVAPLKPIQLQGEPFIKPGTLFGMTHVFKNGVITQTRTKFNLSKYDNDGKLTQTHSINDKENFVLNFYQDNGIMHWDRTLWNGEYFV